MIPKECKRIAEVDFPIAEVSKHSAREKPIVREHPQSLQQWWARRPLAACRAMLLALLLPDPADENCPSEFREKARKLLLQLRGKIGDKPADLRQALLKFIGDFANWDLAADQSYIEVGRGLVKAAHGSDTPLVVDPFAGGGSIPLEALRVGCDVFASDLNPVACLILKVILEDIPRSGSDLADELSRVGDEIKRVAESKLAQFYPLDPDGSRPIAYLWARTVRCESPNCGAEIPLARSFWLSKKANRKRALRYKVECLKSESPFLKFEIFEPEVEENVPNGTVSRANATCPCCHTVLAAPRVRTQLSAQRGGSDVIFDGAGKRVGGALLLSVVTLKTDALGRNYRLPNERDYTAIYAAQKAVAKLPLGMVPVEETPAGGGAGAGRAFSVQKYGMMNFGDLFTARQKLILASLASDISHFDVDDNLRELLAFVVSRLSDRLASLVGWDVGGEKLGHVFSRQALPIVWDFVEGAPFANATGSYRNVIRQIEGAVRGCSTIGSKPGQTQIADACSSPLPDSSASLWFTDPPYYDAVPYADLADFFFVWLKRALPKSRFLHDPFDPENPLTPKTAEIVQDESKELNGGVKDRGFFEDRMAKAFTEGRRILNEGAIGCVVFAHKSTEGWEALLSGMIKGGWVITASWPIATERASRLRSRDSAALATSVHLIGRPRIEKTVGDWGQVLRDLPKRVGDWMERLQSEDVRGADLVFACIGPALEIFSRHSKVETAEGREVGLPEYLVKVWEVVGRTALEQILGTAEAKARNGAAGALEEDARLTALFLWTMQSTSADTAEAAGPSEKEQTEDDEGQSRQKKKGLKLIFDVVRRFAQPLGIRLPDWEGRIIETEKGVVRLLPVRERSVQLFGEDGAQGAASEIERAGDAQLILFPETKEAVAPSVRGRRRVAGREGNAMQREATTLDRVHAAMLLQASGQANALRTLLEAEQERSPDFTRLANALSALYPKENEEKRLLDAMLLAVRK
jgi:putative DNA methylase